MITLFDYLPSQNAWKVRSLLYQLDVPFERALVNVFEGDGRRPEFLRINPTGKVPALRLSDGRTLAESSAILAYLADGTHLLPADAFGRAKVQQWLSFEQEQVEATIGSLRYWTMTGKLDRRLPQLVEAKRHAALRSLALLDQELASRPFVAGDGYTIADIAIYAYASRADEAGLSLEPYAHFRDWIVRVEAQPRFLGTVYPYSIDPASANELP
ncbi:MAG: glutathione S-transferase family protein [Luteimonas sp.]